MTREEAIKNIKTYAIYDEDIPAQVAKALDMAIAALREQEQHRWIPVTMDVREKLVELLNKANSDCVGADCFEGCKFYYEKDCLYKLMADVMISNGVTVQEWIPVTERLPEEPLQTVLVTNGKETCVAVYSVVYDEFGVMCGRGRGQAKRFGVTHWMPLPSPPKGK